MLFLAIFYVLLYRYSVSATRDMQRLNQVPKKEKKKKKYIYIYSCIYMYMLFLAIFYVLLYRYSVSATRDMQRLNQVQTYI